MFQIGKIQLLEPMKEGRFNSDLFRKMQLTYNKLTTMALQQLVCAPYNPKGIRQ